MDEECGFILVVDWLGLMLGPIWRIGRICERLFNTCGPGNADFMVKRMNVIIKSTLSIVEMLREGMPPEAIEYLKNKIRGAVN